MGQEILKTEYSPNDYARFKKHLSDETNLLVQNIKEGKCSSLGPLIGMELEAWLVDESMNPAPANMEFLSVLDSSLASPELAKFNVEFNSRPLALKGDVFSRLRLDLDALWRKAREAARQIGVEILMVGILPTIGESSLTLNNMSDLNRFRALNDQVLRSRGKPIELDIAGRQRLKNYYANVMLESAATSFQLHIQTPLSSAPAVFNASIIASAPMVAISGNSPYLFGTDLWEETRIPLFEQSIGIGGYDGAVYGPLRRVSFGTDYARACISECFEENVSHFPVLLPILFNTPPKKYAHLSLHNGTLWRWNRPLVGFDPDGTPHIRIEHRVMPAGPTLVDSVANAAFYYGLVEHLRAEAIQPRLPFSGAKDNFYQAARHGLNAQVLWMDDRKCRMQQLILDELLPCAMEGLNQLGVDRGDTKYYLNIIQERAKSGNTGANWQRSYMEKKEGQFGAMTKAYLANQHVGRPVHEWGMG